jgi:multicomponent Na+:H+ antiporter subunit A
VKLVFALVLALLFGTGSYLLLHRDLVRVVLGIVVISQASVLTLIAASLSRGTAAIYPLEGRVSDPLSQAMALTAIVIGLAVTALLLALVAVVVETIMTLVFVGVFSRLPKPRRPAGPPARGRRRWNLVAGVVAGAGAFVRVWAALSRPTVTSGAAKDELVRRAPEAHGGDVVTVILADFRGLDTVVEITVLAVAIIGVASLLRRGRSW